MIKDPVAEAVAQAWDTVIERARAQGPEALRKMEEMRREAEREREAEPTGDAEIIQDARPER